MKRSEAEEILAYLSAAFRQALEPTTVAVYVEHLAPYDAKDAQEVARYMVETERFFPAVALLVEELDDSKRLRVFNTPALPAEHQWTDEEYAANKAAGVRILEEFRHRNPTAVVRTFEDVVAKKAPEFDYAEVERKREIARAAAEREAAKQETK